MPPQAVQVPFFYLVGLYVGWQFIRRNSRNGGMAEWRNGGMAEWRNGGRNGGMAERMAEWSNGGNGYIRTLVACRKTNPSLSWLERLVGQKKLDSESCYVARRYLIFPFLASSDFRRQNRISDRNGYIRTIYGRHTPTMTTPTTTRTTTTTL